MKKSEFQFQFFVWGAECHESAVDMLATIDKTDAALGRHNGGFASRAKLIAAIRAAYREIRGHTRDTINGRVPCPKDWGGDLEKLG